MTLGLDMVGLFKVCGLIPTNHRLPCLLERVIKGQSKTANILFSRELAKRYGDRLLAFSLHPGGITTNLARDVTGKALESLMQARKRAPRKQISNGTSTHIVAGFDPAIEAHNGAYLVDCNLAEDQCKEHAKDMVAAERLWKLSEELLQDELRAKL